jgi:hypothetical protein
MKTTVDGGTASEGACLDRMACWWWEACLLGIVDCVASPAEPHVEHAGINRYEETGHEPQV